MICYDEGDAQGRALIDWKGGGFIDCKQLTYT